MEGKETGYRRTAAQRPKLPEHTKESRLISLAESCKKKNEQRVEQYIPGSYRRVSRVVIIMFEDFMDLSTPFTRNAY